MPHMANLPWMNTYALVLLLVIMVSAVTKNSYPIYLKNHGKLSSPNHKWTW